MTTIRFEAIVQLEGYGGFVYVPGDLADQLSTAKRPAVVATVAGRTYDTRLGVYAGQRVLGLHRAMREEVGLSPGDVVSVEITNDDRPREVEVPDDLATALASNPAAAERFDRLSYTGRKERAQAVTSAKRPATRQSRVDAIVAELLAR
ncbi:MAG: hypothetical protein QOK05_857 [Chloroflexota bacterium]|jgi:hypothetical protein|nr:hypothetical protein [Chloroflexota bacterium]